MVNTNHILDFCSDSTVLSAQGEYGRRSAELGTRILDPSPIDIIDFSATFTICDGEVDISRDRQHENNIGRQVNINRYYRFVPRFDRLSWDACEYDNDRRSSGSTVRSSVDQSTCGMRHAFYSYASTWKEIEYVFERLNGLC